MCVVVIALVVIGIVILFIFADRLFHAGFVKQAGKVRAGIGRQDETPVTESDLSRLPEPVARYLRFSGVLGRKRVSFMHLFHSGTFRPGAGRPFMPIRGEYFLTTKRPSFCWYGRISPLPGLAIAARDSYADGRGRMWVKVLSLFNVVNSHTPQTDLSAFGRCLAEMTLAPSFFLDGAGLVWTRVDGDSAECRFSDAGLSVRGTFHVHPGGELARIEVERYYDRGRGQATIETFTGVGREARDYNGLKLPSVMDGYWNLKEGDLHYVHFVIDRVEFE
jgi:hypothetical protein